MYKMSAMFWYRIFFMTELLVAESALVYRFKTRSYFLLRMAAALVMCFAFAFAVPILAENAIWYCAMFFLLFAFTVFMLWFCFKEKFLTVVFYAVAGYTFQHIAHEFYSLCALAMNFSSGVNVSGGTPISFWIYSNSLNAVSINPFTLMVYFFCYGITYFFGYYFVKRRVKDNYEFGGTNVKMFLLAVLILFFDLIVSSFITSYSEADFNKVYLILLDAFNMACCIFAICFQFYVDKQEKLKSELAFMERLWREKRSQYEFTKNNMEIINRKCHDMKHQIRKIGSTSAIEPDIVEEIESLVSVYDTNVKTGNEALDVILTEKSMICNSRGIKLCCIIDGKSIGFISPSDTYALFGNILDNAIEAVSELDSESRTVSLSVSCKNSFAVVNTHNCYEGKLSFDKMLPKTTKADTNMHGYGMKSIKHVVEKYGGEMSVKAENGVFNLNLIFPCGKLRTDSTENEIGIAKHGNMD